MSTNRATRILLFGVVIGAIIFTACVPGSPDEPTGTTILTRVPDTQIEETEVPWPEPRIHPNMIYDPIKERIFMFGGMYFGLKRSLDLRCYHWILGASR